MSRKQAVELLNVGDDSNVSTIGGIRTALVNTMRTI
jgi:hypothetical protein